MLWKEECKEKPEIERKLNKVQLRYFDFDVFIFLPFHLLTLTLT